MKRCWQLPCYAGWLLAGIWCCEVEAAAKWRDANCYALDGFLCDIDPVGNSSCSMGKPGASSGTPWGKIYIYFKKKLLVQIFEKKYSLTVTTEICRMSFLWWEPCLNYLLCYEIRVYPCVFIPCSIYLLFLWHHWPPAATVCMLGHKQMSLYSSKSLHP